MRAEPLASLVVAAEPDEWFLSPTLTAGEAGARQPTLRLRRAHPAWSTDAI